MDIAKHNIEEACKRAGRDTSEVTLIAVSKTKPVCMLQEAYDAGVREFGENKVQEIMDKYDKLPSDIHWHMIGHLQRNKVKYIIDKVEMIHSVDSLRLAETISSEAVKHGVTMKILIEVNVADEETKYGISLGEAADMVDKIMKLPGIIVKGFMTVAPNSKNSEENRKFFRDLHKIAVDIKNKNIDNKGIDVLSMGMTNDYEIAIEEGSTMVRIGTGIFGARNYSI
nr:YggS family pyridoxal phosphate-dependent enzyme [Falcatimonas sp. MSJ-15]